MPQTIVLTVEKSGRDIVINDSISIPKDDLIIMKRDGFCTITLPKAYYSETLKSLIDFIKIDPTIVQTPAVTDNDDLFDKLQKLKNP